MISSDKFSAEISDEKCKGEAKQENEDVYPFSPLALCELSDAGQFRRAALQSLFLVQLVHNLPMSIILMALK